MEKCCVQPLSALLLVEKNRAKMEKARICVCFESVKV